MKELELLYGSYSVSDIQDYFENIIKKHETLTDKSQFEIYIKKIQNRIPFEIKSGYYLEHLALETMQLLGSTERSKIKDKNAESLP